METAEQSPYISYGNENPNFMPYAIILIIIFIIIVLTTFYTITTITTSTFKERRYKPKK